LNDVVGKRATEVIPGIRENDPDLLLIYGRVAATGKPEQVERYVTSLAMWFALSVYRTEPGFFVVVFDVITARKRAEAALRESEAKFSIMFNSNPVPMSLSSVKAGRVLDVNTAWLDLYDWPRDQVVGQTLFGLNLWADLEQRAVLFARLREQGGLHNAEIEHRSKSGRHIHVLWSGINMVVGGEQCLLCSAMDITRHKQTEAARLESETRFRKLLEKAPFALCHSSNAGAITFRNERFLGLFGHTPEEVPDVESWMLRAYPAGHGARPGH
jgi:PAS domain S-box-containing protein